MKILLLLSLNFLLTSSLFCQQWQVWCIPEKNEISENETFPLIFGITGFGKLIPKYSKICIYTDDSTQMWDIRYPDKKSNGVIAVIPTSNSQSKLMDSTSILLTSDLNPTLGNSSFPQIIVKPKKSGDRKITFILTYLANIGNDSSWQTSKAELNYHVNSWFEDHQLALTWIGIVLAFIGLVYTIISTFPQFIEGFVFIKKLSSSNKSQPLRK